MTQGNRPQIEIPNYTIPEELERLEQHLYKFIEKDDDYAQWMFDEFGVEKSYMNAIFTPYSLVQYIIKNDYGYNYEFNGFCEIGTSILEYLEENQKFDNFDYNEFKNIVGMFLLTTNQETSNMQLV